jgi:osmoprotectant transport system permease protein
MSLLSETAVWLGDKAHYRGVDGVPHRLAEHLLLTGVAVAAAAAVALPLGLLLGHTRRGGPVVTAFANASRAIPTLGVLIIFSGIAAIGIGNRAALLALALFAIPPILTNTYAGVQAVDPNVRDAAKGMGMSATEIVRGVEFPNALPLIMSGIRSATLQVIATVTVAAYVPFLGGLGRFIKDGAGQITDLQAGYPAMVAAGLVVALLAVLVDALLNLLQRLVVSPGVSGRFARSKHRPGATTGASVEAQLTHVR